MNRKTRKTRMSRSLASFSALNDDRLVRLLTQGRIERQRRCVGLRRIPKSISLHPVLMTEWLCAAAAEGKSPSLLMAEMLCERWGYRREDV